MTDFKVKRGNEKIGMASTHLDEELIWVSINWAFFIYISLIFLQLFATFSPFSSPNFCSVLSLL